METIAATQLRLEAFIRDYCAQPSINLQVDLSPGSVLSELLIKLSSQLHNQLKNDAEVPSNISTVQAALDSPTDTTSEAIDRVASNFNVIRDTGASVTGRVKVVVAFLRTYYVASNFQLIQPSIGATYTTSRTYRVEAGLSDDPANGELRLYKTGASGPYYFLLPVTGLETGGPAAPHNSSLILNSANTSLDGFVEAKAFGNFSNGRAVETDRQLIARFQAGLSSRGFVSAQSMQTLLPEVFPDIFSGSNGKAILSVVGATDPELIRGKNTTYGLTPFGLADVYLRTAKSVQVGAFDAQAVCTSDVGTPRWQVVLDDNTKSPDTGSPRFPSWFYDIVSITYVDDAGVTRTTYPQLKVDQSGTSVTFTALPEAANQLGGGDVSANDVARFSKYQRCTFDVVLDGVAAEVDATKWLKVTVTYMPYIGDIQDYMLQSAHRVLAADYLVKAVVPCTVSMQLTLERSSSKGGSTDSVKQSIKKAIYDYVNELPFGEPVAVSRIVDICHNFDIKRVDLPLQLTGSLLVPSSSPGQLRTLVTSDVMTIPADQAILDYGASAKTAMFFANFEDLGGRDTISISLN